jgi:hypothetical protein
MSGHGKRETALLFDAVRWKDRVGDDARSEEGRAMARAHRVSPELVLEAARLIAGYIARGEDVVSRADLVIEGGKRQAQRVVKYLEARGHIERVDSDLIRPIGTRPGELPLS